MLMSSSRAPPGRLAHRGVRPVSVAPLLRDLTRSGSGLSGCRSAPSPDRPGLWLGHLAPSTAQLGLAPAPVAARPAAVPQPSLFRLPSGLADTPRSTPVAMRAGTSQTAWSP